MATIKATTATIGNIINSAAYLNVKLFDPTHDIIKDNECFHFSILNPLLSSQ